MEARAHSVLEQTYTSTVYNHSLRLYKLLSVEDGVQEQLEVSLEHSLTQ